MTCPDRAGRLRSPRGSPVLREGERPSAQRPRAPLTPEASLAFPLWNVSGLGEAGFWPGDERPK